MKLFAAFVLLLSGIAHAHDVPDTVSEMLCYGKAMIGYDSVINARVGVLPENQVEVFGYKTPFELSHLQVVLAAYKWEGTPHQYATHIFYRCAQENVK